MVTVRPNFQDSVHVGYVTGLKKFTEYYTSVLCFTTPGDGPRSPPRAVRTHEDGKWLFVFLPHFGGEGTAASRSKTSSRQDLLFMQISPTKL